MERSVLFVDDEPQILKSLSRLFLDTDYSVYTAESGAEALGVLSREKIDLVISDMRMPNMDGYEFLNKVKQEHPGILRVILSGYADEKVILKALQQNVAKLYMFKPWENDKLLKLIDQIFETDALLNNSELMALINNIEELPTIKTSYQRIINYIENDAEISDIAKLIEFDQSIASKVLHIANSAYFGIRTGSVRQAVSYLGLTNVRSLVMSTSIMETMEVKGIVGANIESLWRHAFITNRLLNYIYEKILNKKLADTAMAAGLLHNVGRVFLLKAFPVQYMSVLRTLEGKAEDILELEMNTFKITHQQTGGYLLKWWELPLPIVEAALYHHTPFDGRIIEKELIPAVHLAQRYAFNYARKKYNSGFEETVFDCLGFTKEEFETKLRDFSAD